jgi:hypothetical protein
MPVLPAIVAEFDTRDMDRAFVELEREIEREMLDVFARHGQRIAGAAKANHEFQNRTNVLEASIDGLPPTGSVFAGTLQGGVAAIMPYASYLEGHPDLRPGHSERPFPVSEASGDRDRAVLGTRRRGLTRTRVREGRASMTAARSTRSSRDVREARYPGARRSTRLAAVPVRGTVRRRGLAQGIDEETARQFARGTSRVRHGRCRQAFDRDARRCGRRRP